MTDWDRSHGLPALSRVWQQLKLSDVSLGTRPRYSLVVDEDVKKPNKQTSILHFAKKAKTKTKIGGQSLISNLDLKLQSGILIKSTHRDRKKLLTLSKVDFFPFSGKETQIFFKGCCNLPKAKSWSPGLGR